MKKHRDEGRDIRDRRRKQFLRRVQEQEWKKEQWQLWAADEESYPPDQADLDRDRDSTN